MKVLLINGSPHAHGCTFTALSVVADELQRNGVETEIIHVGHKDIRGCIGSRLFINHPKIWDKVSANLMKYQILFEYF